MTGRLGPTAWDRSSGGRSSGAAGIRRRYPIRVVANLGKVLGQGGAVVSASLGVARGDRVGEARRQLGLVRAPVVPDVGEHVDDDGHVVADVVGLAHRTGEPVDALEDRRTTGAAVPR